MARILVHVEGQTEERFVDTVLAPHLYDVGFKKVRARLLGNARQRSRRGGIRTWSSVRKDILNHLTEDQAIIVATMVDYYGLPHTWPGLAQSKTKKTLKGRADAVQLALSKDIAKSMSGSYNRRRFVPYVVMHEFEGLLFSDSDRFAWAIGKPDLSNAFLAIREEFNTPEDINNSPEAHPSRRICDLYEGYQKPLMGVVAAEEIGLATIRKECQLFDRWVKRLEKRVEL